MGLMKRLFWLSMIFVACAAPTDDSAEDSAAPAEDVASPAAQICEPGATQTGCAGPSAVLTCAADGTEWVEQACPDAQLCFAGRCVDYPCLPGSLGCSDATTVAACIDDQAGSYEWLPLRTCIGGLCQAGDCVGTCEFDVKQNLGKACSTFAVDVTGVGTGDCPDTGLLAVPSSGDDRIAVFDIQTVPPTLLEGSPFSTCGDPSRILLTPDGHVIAGCRLDGRVARHDPAGKVLWAATLSGCTAVRGVALSPSGRLFVGCTDTGVVSELDPETGAEISCAQSDVSVYGLVADEDGVYAMDATALSKLDTSGDLALAWTVPGAGYGIAVDAQHRIWMTEDPGLVARSTADGSVAITVEIQEVVDAPADLDTSGCNGVTVGVDGSVVAGCADLGSLVLVYHPTSEEVERLYLPSGDNHPRGVAVDALGNIFTVNRGSGTASRFDAITREAVSFGAGALSEPYGYSGDLTATSQCLGKEAPTIWRSTVLDFGDPETHWIGVEWRATVPDGTTLTVQYRVDGGGWVDVTSGEPLDQEGRTFQVRATLTGDGTMGPTLEALAIFYE